MLLIFRVNLLFSIVLWVKARSGLQAIEHMHTFDGNCPLTAIYYTFLSPFKFHTSHIKTVKSINRFFLLLYNKFYQKITKVHIPD